MDLTLTTRDDRPLRLFQIKGDGMEPGLRGGDFVMVAPAERHLYDAIYLLDFGDGEAPYAASRSPGAVSIRHPNPKYTVHVLTPAEFNAAVTAIVVAEVRVIDRQMIQAARRPLTDMRVAA